MEVKNMMFQIKFLRSMTNPNDYYMNPNNGFHSLKRLL
jgi:hypothetical protein